jgi:lysophospholipase L1-like esterase
VKKLALSLAGVLLALVLAEGVLRLVDYGAIRPRLDFDVHTRALVEAGHFATHPTLFWRQADGPYPPLEHQWRIVHLDDPLPARTGRFRIICVGDSCTRLSGQSPPYSVLLEQELDPRRVEVFNASLPGYTSHQGLAWLELQLLDYAPDLVVVYFGWNDHWRSTGLTDRQYAAFLDPRRPRLLRLFQRRQEPPPLRVDLAEYAENLEQIADLVAAGGGRTLFLTAPYNFTTENIARFLANGNIVTGDQPQELHEQYLQVVRRLQGHPEAQVFDLARIFKDINAPRLLLQRDGIHPTEVGHTVIGTLLSDAIAERFLGAPASPASPVAVGQILLAHHLASQADWQGAVQRHRQAVVSAPDEPQARLGLAWLLATSPDDAVRDGHEALSLIDQTPAGAIDSLMLLDVRAAALAEVGNFEAAAALMGTALAQLEAAPQAPAEMITAFRDRKERFSRGEPYRLPARPNR